MSQVKVWREQVTIPTYRACQPETAPLFLENRAYQGSSGKVYPFPVTEKICDEKEDVEYSRQLCCGFWEGIDAPGFRKA